MKKFFLFIIFFLYSIFLYSIDINSLTPTGWVNDYASLLTQEEKIKIESLISEFEHKTGNEIAVVIIKSLEDNNLEDFTNRLFERWGIGKKGKDNGIMLFIALKERKIRIEIGYGLEAFISDSLAGNIIREVIVPYFKQNQYYDGIYAGVFEIASIIAQKTGVVLDKSYTPKVTRVNKIGSIVFLFIFIFFILPVFMRHPWLFLFFISSGRGGGRYYGGGFGGGGFGGFGGGLSGGGGASGGW
ncbi:MAG: TPM domain-containing protein [Candidatus Goldbacteria bacterium]|nr:TPM domain-containing protein [Candidatus Goldiibacteriota bacterium]